MKPTIGRRWAGTLLAVAIVLPLTAGCAAKNNADLSSTEAIDPPPADVEQTMLQATDAEAVFAGKDELTVYLQDRNGFIAPLTLRLNDDGSHAQTPEETAIAWMTKTSGLTEQLPPGFSPVLPQGTKVKTVLHDPQNKSVTIDFAAPFPTVPAKQERKMVEALVWTMTELPDVTNVRLTVDGVALKELPVSGLPLSDRLSRDFGINVEQAAGLNASRSMAVTLYFSARSEDGEGYFVPVTRLVDRTPDRNRAALEELIRGPLDTRKLQSVLTPNVSVDNISLASDTVNVALNDPGWEPEMAVPSDTMQALLLTLTGMSGEPKARITINGEATFKDSNDHTYAEAAARPTFINALER